MIPIEFIFSSLIIFFIPGYFLYTVFLKQSIKTDPILTLILSMALSLSFIPVISFIFTEIGIEINRFSLLIIFLLMGGYILISYKKTEKHIKINDYYIYLILLIILIGSLILRYYRFMDFPVAPGTDSQHHTLISQMIVDNGGIPNNFEPYYHLKMLSYPFGFHSLVAFFYFVSGIQVPKLVNLVGQTLNAMSLLTVFYFIYSIFKDKTMALLGSYLVAFVSIFPFFYSNWGRIPGLEGMFVLPVFLVLIIQFIEKEETDYKMLILLSILMSGMFFIYYRIAIFSIIFIIIYLIFNQIALKQTVWRLGIVFLLSLIIILPQILILLKAYFSVFHDIQIPDSQFSIFRIAVVFPYYSNIPLLFFSVAGTFLGILKKDKRISLIAIWISVLVILSYLRFVPSMFDFITVLLISYFAVIVLSSYFLKLLIEKIKLPQNFLWFVLIILIPVFSIGLSNTFDINNLFVTDNDVKAMDWIKENTEVNDSFLSNYLVIPYIYGMDAGFWIPIFTHRISTVPPQNYLLERSEVNYSKYTVFESFENISTIDFLKNNNIKYIYFGDRLWGETREKRLQMLLKSDYVKVVYNEGNVWIFQIK